MVYETTLKLIRSNRGHIGMIVGGISGGIIILCIFGFIGREYPKSAIGKFVNFITGSRLAILGFCFYVLYLIFVELPMALL